MRYAPEDAGPDVWVSPDDLRQLRGVLRLMREWFALRAQVQALWDDHQQAEAMRVRKEEWGPTDALLKRAVEGAADVNVD